MIEHQVDSGPRRQGRQQGERYQAFERAALAAHPGKAVRQHTAGQELTKLPGDELGEAASVGSVGGGAQEVIQVISDDPVEHARLRVARLVAALGTAHAPA